MPEPHRDFAAEAVAERRAQAEHAIAAAFGASRYHLFGDELYAVMREIKALFDPHGILNPGKVL